MLITSHMDLSCVYSKIISVSREMKAENLSEQNKVEFKTVLRSVPLSRCPRTTNHSVGLSCVGSMYIDHCLYSYTSCFKLTSESFLVGSAASGSATV